MLEKQHIWLSINIYTIFGYAIVDGGMY